MTDLEKEMHEEYQSRPRTGRRVDDAIKAAAIVAERHIEQKLLQHGVSGKQPDYETIHATAQVRFGDSYHQCKSEMFKEFIAGAQWALSQVACASGAVDKTVSGGNFPCLDYLHGQQRCEMQCDNCKP